MFMWLDDKGVFPTCTILEAATTRRELSRRVFQEKLFRTRTQRPFRRPGGITELLWGRWL